MTERLAFHLHAVLGLQDGTLRGGHFLSGVVRPTLEVTMIETVIFRHDGLAVIL
jgi:hypothetical protein